MQTILSTKKLMLNQRSLLLHAGFSLVEYDAIHINFVPFKAPDYIENAIFTSQNAVETVMGKNIKIDKCFCVGEKTKALLEQNDCKVIMMTEYASELSTYLVDKHKTDKFYFFCGNIRSEEIPSKLKENNITFEEIEVYKTTLNPKKFERQFDAILFFSPSGVRSFVEGNTTINGEIPAFAGITKAVCIGTTTASEAKKYTDNVIISNATTVESVIAKAAKVLNN